MKQYLEIKEELTKAEKITKEPAFIRIEVADEAEAAGNIKKVSGIAWANVKKVNGIATTNIKKLNGIAAQ